MIMFFYLIPVIFLILLSIIDLKTFNLKTAAIPSVLTTISILICFLLSLNLLTLMFSLMVAWLMFDMRLYEGEPDLKMIVACGCILPDIIGVGIFALLMSIFSIIYKVMLKKHNFKEVPFIPVILISYIGTLVYVLWM